MHARPTSARAIHGALSLTLLLLAACGEDATEVVLGTGPVSGAGGRPKTGVLRGASGGDVPLKFPKPPLCTVSDETATKLSREVYILLDRSESMKAPLLAPARGTWWSAARDAVTRFVADPSLAGVGVGLHFLPDASNVDGCSAGLGEPLVPVSPMPQAADLVRAAFADQGPSGRLPDGYALSRHLVYLATHPAPAEHGSLVLVTSGPPPRCGTGSIEPSQELRKWRALASISTHVIALNAPSARDEFDALAREGGTPGATFIDGGDVAARLHDALRSVLDVPHGCWYAAPSVPAGALPGTIMSSLIVTVTPRDGRPARVVPPVGLAEDCHGEAAAGWYAVLGAGRYGIALCPRSCADAAASSVTYSYGYECGRTHPPGH